MARRSLTQLLYAFSALCQGPLVWPNLLRPRWAALAAGWWSGPLGEGGFGGYPVPCYDTRVKPALTLLLASLLVGAMSCSAPWVSPPGGDSVEIELWRGQIVELDRDQGYMVVRSRERFLDYVFQITPETEITSQVQVSSSLKPGQWVTVEYRKDRSEHGPPAALRVVVIR